MNTPDPNALTPRQSAQLQALARYLAAMERGDADMLAASLREADADPTLEHLILALHSVYSEVDATAPTFGEIDEAEAMLATFVVEADGAVRAVPRATEAPANPGPSASQIAETFGVASPATLNGASHPTQGSPSLRRRTSGRGPRSAATTPGDTLMSTRYIPHATTSAPTSQGSTQVAPAPSASFTALATEASRRWRPRLRLTQGLVAALIVAALLSSFYIILQRLAPPRGATLVSKVTYAGPFTGKRLVLAGSWTGEVWALDPINGNAYWHYNLGDGNPVTDLFVEGAYVVVGDTYLSNPRVVVIRLSDGKQLWTREISSGAGVMGPIYADQNAVYLSNSTAAYAFRLNDGKQLWRASNADVEATAPGMVFLAVSILKNPQNLNSVQNSIVAVRSSDGKQLWSYRVSDPAYPEITRVIGRTLYLGGNSLAPLGPQTTGSYLEIDTKTGKVIGMTPPMPANWSVVQVTDTQLVVVIRSRQDQLCVYRFPSIVQRWCTPENDDPNQYTLLSQYTTAVLNGSVYLQYGIQDGSNGVSIPGVAYTEPPYRPAVAAFDATTGRARTLWAGPLIPAFSPKSPTGISMGAALDGEQSIVGAQGTVYVGTNSGIFAVDGATGKQRWFFEPKAGDTFLILTAL